jgi:ADP-ribose pyrophosphatase YjhB (NUDIX family)
LARKSSLTCYIGNILIKEGGAGHAIDAGRHGTAAADGTDMDFHSLRRAMEPLLRRVLHVFWQFQRGMTLGVRAVVIDRDGRIFLVRHTYVSGWHLPGGGVEPGETVAQALARELREEGNIELTEAPVLSGIVFNEHVSRRDHVAIFVVRAFRQDAAPVPDREIIAHGFFAPEALPPDTTASTRARIAETLSGRPLPERG